MIILLLMWLILSLYAIYYVDHYCYWKHLFKIFMTATILTFLINSWRIYDPEMNHMIVTIETNPAWEWALGSSFIGGICITGPIAGLYILKEKMQERRG